MLSKIVARKPEFKQVCVWPGTFVGPERIEEFEAFMLEEYGTRVQYLEEVETIPQRDPRTKRNIPGTGGCVNTIFAVHREDVSKFAVPRLAVGIRWIEDVLSTINRQAHRYPRRLKDYKTWDT